MCVCVFFCFDFRAQQEQEQQQQRAAVGHMYNISVGSSTHTTREEKKRTNKCEKLLMSSRYV